MEIIERAFYLQRIEALLGKGGVVVLTGHRRSGKSCLLESLAGRLTPKGNVIYLDMEDPDHADIRSYEDLHSYILTKVDPVQNNYLLVDEVQEIVQFEKTLRYWAKQDRMNVVVTGSNATMLSSEIATTFAGRYFQVHVSSLDYAEFLQFHTREDNIDSLASYLRWGGLPFLRNIPEDDTRVRMDYLGSIYDTIFVKDIVACKQIRNVSFLNNLARFIADNTGKMISANSIASYMKHLDISVSTNTVADYIGSLCDTYMIDRVGRFDISGKRIFDQQEKYYFEDIGIRNYLCKDKRATDLEKVLENIVYLKLKNSGYAVYVGQLNGKEIDFVATKGEGTVYFQVALSISGRETYEREFGNLKLIRDHHPKYVVTLDPLAELVNDSGIRVLPLREFLLSSL